MPQNKAQSPYRVLHSYLHKNPDFTSLALCLTHCVLILFFTQYRFLKLLLVSLPGYSMCLQISTVFFSGILPLIPSLLPPGQLLLSLQISAWISKYFFQDRLDRCFSSCHHNVLHSCPSWAAILSCSYSLSLS